MAVTEVLPFGMILLLCLGAVFWCALVTESSTDADSHPAAPDDRGRLGADLKPRAIVQERERARRSTRSAAAAADGSVIPGDARHFLDSWAVEVKGGERQARSVARQYGFDVVEKVSSIVVTVSWQFLTFLFRLLGNRRCSSERRCFR